MLARKFCKMWEIRKTFDLLQLEPRQNHYIWNTEVILGKYVFYII